MLVGWLNQAAFSQKMTTSDHFLPDTDSETVLQKTAPNYHDFDIYGRV
jgi:hypothetical protein